jgi:hypothetical protein
MDATAIGRGALSYRRTGEFALDPGSDGVQAIPFQVAVGTYLPFQPLHGLGGRFRHLGTAPERSFLARYLGPFPERKGQVIFAAEQPGGDQQTIGNQAGTPAGTRMPKDMLIAENPGKEDVLLLSDMGA